MISSDSEIVMKPSTYVTGCIATLYVLSGVSQPLLMEWAKEAGLANKSCQLYMFFYYVGTSSVIVTFFCGCRGGGSEQQERILDTPRSTLAKICGIACIDIAAQTMNYTGSTMAGPTIFAIIYSSVTIWCAVLSRCLLNRRMGLWQWFAVFVVFGGLTITAFQSVDLGAQVLRGALLVMAGSCLHAFMYVLSEGVMNNNNGGKGEKSVSARKYCAIYGSMACFGYFAWQMFYTSHHYEDLILQPMLENGTSWGRAIFIYFLIALMSCVHSITFFHTVKYVPGGATSAGVMKALQAVLVFAATSWVFCGRIGGLEMCFTTDKAISLVIVVFGVTMFGKATELYDDGTTIKSKHKNSPTYDPRKNNSAEDEANLNELTVLLTTKMEQQQQARAFDV